MEKPSFNTIKKNLFLNFILINMDETINWKTITTDDDGEPILKYDPHRDEIVNVHTGEVIQGHD